MAKYGELICCGSGNLYQKHNRWMTEIHPEVILFLKLRVRVKGKKKEDYAECQTRIRAYVRKFKNAEIRFVPHPYSGVQKSLCVHEADRAKWAHLAFGSTREEPFEYPIAYRYSTDAEAFSKLLRQEALDKEERFKLLLKGEKPKEIYDWIKPRHPKRSQGDWGIPDVPKPRKRRKGQSGQK